VKLLAFNPFKHLDYARSVTKVSISADTGGIVAENDAGVPQGVVLFDSWSSTAVTAHISIQNPLALRTLHREAFRYIFETCGKMMMLGFTASDNIKAVRLNKHFGFTEIARIPDADRVGVDVIIFRMLREECRYLINLKEAA